ncbi:hypothetical protein, partial [Acinetobacter baumannii]|uniref:hypothetical protein n=1 Tax=Acinetobacter baumannii TaxID=470 RepID=UPI001BC88DCF
FLKESNTKDICERSSVNPVLRLKGAVIREGRFLIKFHQFAHRHELWNFYLLVRYRAEGFIKNSSFL